MSSPAHRFLSKPGHNLHLVARPPECNKSLFVLHYHDKYDDLRHLLTNSIVFHHWRLSSTRLPMLYSQDPSQTSDDDLALSVCPLWSDEVMLQMPFLTGYYHSGSACSCSVWCFPCCIKLVTVTQEHPKVPVIKAWVALYLQVSVVAFLWWFFVTVDVWHAI